MKRWQEKEFSNHVYYDDSDGKIIGLVTRVGNHNTIYLAKVYNPMEGILGQYVDMDYSKKAIADYWDIQERTLLEDR